MVDILHAVTIEAPVGAVYDALTTREGLSGWWTEDTRSGKDGARQALHFQFGERGFFDMDVVTLEPNSRVVWRVTDGPEEWIGTTIEWQIEPDDGHANVWFRHLGWREPVRFMHHCSTKWATFLMSLRSLVETGKGAPYPDDIKVGRDS